MHLTFRNVNDAFSGLVYGFHTAQRYLDTGEPWCAPTRDWGRVVRRPFSNPNGEGYTLSIEEPVTITLTHPTERVLFNPARDANPFFHLYESLWMLAGRNDVAPLAYYSKGMARFSDDGKTFNGAYGYRWRHADANCNWDDRVVPFEVHDVDQLDVIVDIFKCVPETRRAVLQMWNVKDDLLKIGQPNPQQIGKSGVRLEGASKDTCCNLSVMFSLRRTWPEKDEPGEDTFLDMTVTNRSNDLIWGMLGANVVHFSFLQEYMAARIGVGVGRMHTVTNNLHVYNENSFYKWEPEKWLAADERSGGYRDGALDTTTEANENWRTFIPFQYVPLVKDAPATFEKELPLFVEHWSGPKGTETFDQYSERALAEGVGTAFTEPFFKTTADPMLAAFCCYKAGHLHDAFTILSNAEGMADDWRIAGEQWLTRRIKK